MDTLDESKSFFKHVFNFDDDSKTEILNILQYSLLAIIPVVILNKTMQKYVPEADEAKSSVEVTAEVIIQVIVMFIGLLLIHRMVTFVPTYSGAAYPEFHIVYIVLGVLMITMSLQTKLGEKVSLLVDRLLELWNGKPDPKKKKGGSSSSSAVKVVQPISGGNPMGGYTEGTAISALPTMAAPTQQVPDYDSMYRPDTTQMVGAATPGVVEGMTPYEPMAANSVLGGGAFGSW
jgi:hypothetical protein